MRILTGIQPSGRLHLGNYLGAIRQSVELQARADDCYYFIADYHALTTVSDPAALREATLGVALDFLAAGLDPEKVVFFRQSDVPEVQELTWLLSIVASVSRLELAHSYKDKLAHGKEATHALFSYPVLMAADILLYRSDLVPVGKDQKQHLEITRDLAVKFNRKFGEVFKLPEGFIPDSVATVPGTDGQKMSKSYNNTIPLSGSDKEVKKAIMGIVTDSAPVEAPKDPEQNNIYRIYKAVATPEKAAEMAERLRAGGYGYGDAKKELLRAYHELLDPFRERRAALEAHLDDVRDRLAAGAAKARVEARKTLAAARRAVGLD
ncbi:MAG: tryptophan--tRNA ligase [Kiritimatiellae bacterium]|nr:tryptophan--tRNA ligase [Kiritimatiellia bacterium]